MIIPVYNCEEYVREALDSVLCQTLQDIEILCIDDGSTDKTPEILRNYQKRNEKIQVFTQKNSGQSAARNRGIEEAAGEYIYFLDSDDKIIPKTLELLYTSAKAKSLDVVYCNGQTFFESQDLEKKFANFKEYYIRKGPYDRVLNGPELFCRMEKENDIKTQPCLQMIAKAHLQKYGIRFPEGIIHEDNYFTFAALIHAQRAMCLDNILFYRRIRRDSVMTKRRTVRNADGQFIAAMKILEEIESMDLNSETVFAVSRYVWQHFRNVKSIFEAYLTHEEQNFYKEDVKCKTALALLKPFELLSLADKKLPVMEKKFEQMRNDLNENRAENRAWERKWRLLIQENKRLAEELTAAKQELAAVQNQENL